MQASRKQVTVHSKHATGAPIIYLPVVMGNGSEVYDRCRELDCPPFTLVAIGGLDWNRELSPLGMRRDCTRCRAFRRSGCQFS